MKWINAMTSKVGRNDPCPCGSGKKYKQCCWKKRLPLGKRKFKATVLSGGGEKKQPNLMERTFGNAIRAAEKEEKPPVPPTPPSTSEKDSPENKEKDSPENKEKDSPENKEKDSPENKETDPTKDKEE